MTEQEQQVMTKDPKKVESGKKLAQCNHKNRGKLKAQKSKSRTNLPYYGAGAVVAIGLLGVISYYVYQSKTPKNNPANQSKEAPVYQPKNITDKSNMD